MCEDLIIAYAISMDQNCPLGLIMCAIAGEGLAAGVKQISAGRLQTADPSIPVHKARRDSLAGNSRKIQWGMGTFPRRPAAAGVDLFGRELCSNETMILIKHVFFLQCRISSYIII